MNQPEDRRSRDRGRPRMAGDALYSGLRLVGGWVRGFYAAVVAALSFAFFLVVGAIWAFAEISQEVLAGSTQAFDEAVLTWVEGHRTDLMDHIALELTALGNFGTLTVLVLVVSVFLWMTHHRISVGLLLVAMMGGALMNTLLKNIFDRPRPSIVEAGTEVMSLSFPSGHAMSSFIAYSAIAYLGGRLGPTRRLRWTTWFVAAIIILAVGFSRIYLGVHYPSDVLAGYVAGLAWLAFVISGLAAIRYFSGRKPEVIEDEQDLHAEEERDRGLRQ